MSIDFVTGVLLMDDYEHQVSWRILQKYISGKYVKYSKYLICLKIGKYVIMYIFFLSLARLISNIRVQIAEKAN